LADEDNTLVPLLFSGPAIYSTLPVFFLYFREDFPVIAPANFTINHFYECVFVL